jgi:hypothetical protein
MKRLLPLVLVLALSCAAAATDIYNNLGADSNGTDSIFSFGPLADSFSTGAGGFTLASVGLKLEDIGDPTGSFTIQLLADNNISPGNPIYTIATVQDSFLSDSLQDYFFVLAQPQVLDPNTRYWIGLSSNDNSVAYWSWSVDTSGIGVKGEYFANQNGIFSTDNGAYQMELSDVPEPGTLIMLGSGIVGVLGVVRRRMLV